MFTLRKPFKEIIYEGENELELLSRTLPEHHHGGNEGYAESHSHLHLLLPVFLLRLFAALITDNIYYPA